MRYITGLCSLLPCLTLNSLGIRAFPHNTPQSTLSLWYNVVYSNWSAKPSCNEIYVLSSVTAVSKIIETQNYVFFSKVGIQQFQRFGWSIFHTVFFLYMSISMGVSQMIQCPILVGLRGWWNRFCSYSAVQQTTLSHYLRSSKIDMGGELSIHAGAEVLKINLVHQKHGLPIIWQYWFAGACTIWVYLCQNTCPFSLPLAKCSFAWWYNFIFLYTVCHCCFESTST